METATLTKTVDQMSESFAQPDVQKSFESWAERAGKEARQEEKKEQKKYETASERHEISLKDMSPEEREWFEKVGQRDESAKEPQKDAAKRTEQRSDAKESKPDAKAAEKSATSESTKAPLDPIAADRYWQRKFENKEEHENHWRQVQASAEIALAYINQHPEKAQIEQGLRGLTADKSQEFQMDLHSSLAEIPNAGAVLRHLALVPADRKALRDAKDWKELRASIGTISRHYAVSAPQASPKPRAPRPPSEVGGRGAAGDDGFHEGMDFGSFEKNMTARHHARHGR